MASWHEPILTGGDRRRHTWWPTFWAIVCLVTIGLLLTVILLAGRSTGDPKAGWTWDFQDRQQSVA